MKKIIISIMICCMLMFSCITLTGCEVLDTLDTALELEEMRKALDKANGEIEELKVENATLRFKLAFPNSIVDKDVILERAELTVEDNCEGDALQVIGNATVIINGGIFNGGNTPAGGAGNTAVWCNSKDAKVIINDGTFTIGGLADGDTGHVDLIYCKAGTIEINGGYFEGADETVWLVNCMDDAYTSGIANIIITGGTFKNFNPAECISEGENTSFVAEGYTVVSVKINSGTADEYTLYTVVDESSILPVEPDQF